MTSQPTPPVRIPILVWWYLATFVASAVLLLTQQVTQINPLYISIVQFAPTIALLALPQARRAALSAARAVPRAVFVRRLLLALAVSGAFLSAIVLFAVLTGTERHVSPFPSIGMLVLYLALQFVGAMGEEVGWRGFLQPALETRIPRLAAAASVGVLWALWHVQMFTDVLTGALFIVFCTALSIVFAWCARGSVWQRALIGGLLHFVVNVALLFAFADGGSVLGSVVAAVLLLAGGFAVRALRRPAAAPITAHVSRTDRRTDGTGGVREDEAWAPRRMTSFGG